MKSGLSLLSFLLSVNLIAQTDPTEAFLERFILVEDGGTIELPAGHFDLTATLWLDGKSDVTIRGAGMDQTILNFADQTQGAEGIKVTNARNIIIEDLTTENSKGDLIKTQRWTALPSAA